MKPIEKADILRYMRSAKDAPELIVYASTDSTNKRALLYAEERRPASPLMFIASEQQAGRGRLGRSFSSPEGGIYMTLLTPVRATADLTALTTYAVTAVCKAIEELTPLSPKIKWVNDVYIGERKLSGILAQGAVDAESGRITHVAMGIGINVASVELPPEISEIATSLAIEGCDVDRAALAARITEIYLGGIERAGSPEVTEEYRRRSMLTGSEVNVIRPDRTYAARVIGIGDGCELIVEREDGSIEKLTTGDVSVRKK